LSVEERIQLTISQWYNDILVEEFNKLSKIIQLFVCEDQISKSLIKSKAEEFLFTPTTVDGILYEIGNLDNLESFVQSLINSDQKFCLTSSAYDLDFISLFALGLSKIGHTKMLVILTKNEFKVIKDKLNHLKSIAYINIKKDKKILETLINIYFQFNKITNDSCLFNSYKLFQSLTFDEILNFFRFLLPLIKNCCKDNNIDVCSNCKGLTQLDILRFKNHNSDNKSLLALINDEELLSISSLMLEFTQKSDFPINIWNSYLGKNQDSSLISIHELSSLLIDIGVISIHGTIMVANLIHFKDKYDLFEMIYSYRLVQSIDYQDIFKEKRKWLSKIDEESKISINGIRLFFDFIRNFNAINNQDLQELIILGLLFDLLKLDELNILKNAIRSYNTYFADQEIISLFNRFNLEQKDFLEEVKSKNENSLCFWLLFNFVKRFFITETFTNIFNTILKNEIINQMLIYLDKNESISINEIQKAIEKISIILTIIPTFKNERLFEIYRIIKKYFWNIIINNKDEYQSNYILLNKIATSLIDIKNRLGLSDLWNPLDINLINEIRVQIKDIRRIAFRLENIRQIEESQILLRELSNIRENFLSDEKISYLVNNEYLFLLNEIDLVLREITKSINIDTSISKVSSYLINSFKNENEFFPKLSSNDHICLIVIDAYSYTLFKDKINLFRKFPNCLISPLFSVLPTSTGPGNSSIFLGKPLDETGIYNKKVFSPIKNELIDIFKTLSDKDRLENYVSNYNELFNNGLYKKIQNIQVTWPIKTFKTFSDSILLQLTTSNKIAHDELFTTKKQSFLSEELTEIKKLILAHDGSFSMIYTVDIDTKIHESKYENEDISQLMDNDIDTEYERVTKSVINLIEKLQKEASKNNKRFISIIMADHGSTFISKFNYSINNILEKLGLKLLGKRNKYRTREGIYSIYDIKMRMNDNNYLIQRIGETNRHRVQGRFINFYLKDFNELNLIKFHCKKCLKYFFTAETKDKKYLACPECYSTKFNLSTIGMLKDMIHEISNEYNTYIHVPKKTSKTIYFNLPSFVLFSKFYEVFSEIDNYNEIYETALNILNHYNEKFTIKELHDDLELIFKEKINDAEFQNICEYLIEKNIINKKDSEYFSKITNTFDKTKLYAHGGYDISELIVPLIVIWND